MEVEIPFALGEKVWAVLSPHTCRACGQRQGAWGTGEGYVKSVTVYSVGRNALIRFLVNTEWGEFLAADVFKTEDAASVACKERQTLEVKSS